MTDTALSVHEKIATYAKTASQAVRRVEKPLQMRKLDGKMLPEWVRQGDVMLTHLAALPEDAICCDTATSGALQLAPGTTMGSRHCLRLHDGVMFYRNRSATPLQGGYIVATDRCYIEHPEHAHMDLPAGIYAVTYQRDMSAEEIRAVRD